MGDYCVYKPDSSWVRGLITNLEEELAEIFLCDRGVQCRAPRRLLKLLAEQFSHQAPHCLKLQVSDVGLPPDMSEDTMSALMRRVQDLNDKSERVTLKVGII